VPRLCSAAATYSEEWGVCPVESPNETPKAWELFVGKKRVFPKMVGFSNKNIIHFFIGISIINRPFWGTPIFGNTYIGDLFIF